MSLDRREFLDFATVGMATGKLAWPRPTRAAPRPKVEAIVFDAFPIFDLRPVSALAEELFPGRGAELSKAWRTRQFEYQWLRALSEQYADFWQTTEDGLLFAAESQNLDLTVDAREKLMSAYLQLEVWPDVAPALQSLRDAGFRLGFLSNATRRILEAGIRSSGLEDVFEHVLSTDEIKTYKPDPRAYHMAIEAFALEMEQILFVAFAGWDAAGAKSFGYTTFWANRMDSPAERLGSTPDGVGRSLDDLVVFVKARR
jgi:2-haloacid dehalogenase